MVFGLGFWRFRACGVGQVGKLLRGIRKILHDPKYLISWELFYCSILRSSRTFSLNSAW